MKASNALRKLTISQDEAESLIVQRETYASLKKRLEALEAVLKANEAALVAKLEAGAEVNASYEMTIRVKEMRHPHWKAHFAQVAGAAAAERVLRETVPTTSKSLIVK